LGRCWLGCGFGYAQPAGWADFGAGGAVSEIFSLKSSPRDAVPEMLSPRAERSRSPAGVTSNLPEKLLKSVLLMKGCLIGWVSMLSETQKSSKNFLALRAKKKEVERARGKKGKGLLSPGG
jgi:hypothetical protein